MGHRGSAASRRVPAEVRRRVIQRHLWSALAFNYCCSGTRGDGGSPTMWGDTVGTMYHRHAFVYYPQQKEGGVRGGIDHSSLVYTPTTTSLPDLCCRVQEIRRDPGTTTPAPLRLIKEQQTPAEPLRNSRRVIPRNIERRGTFCISSFGVFFCFNVTHLSLSGLLNVHEWIC